MAVYAAVARREYADTFPRQPPWLVVQCLGDVEQWMPQWGGPQDWWYEWGRWEIPLRVGMGPNVGHFRWGDWQWVGIHEIVPTHSPPAF